MPIDIQVEFVPSLRRFNKFTQSKFTRGFLTEADKMIRTMQTLTKDKFQAVTPEFENPAISVRGSWKKGFNRKSRMSVSGKVFSRHPGSATLDTGAVRHRPPANNLKPWLRAKFGLSGRQLNRVAFGMAKRIGQEGLPLGGKRPSRIYTKAFAILIPEFDKLVHLSGIAMVARFRTGPLGR